jgi:hypothetical protein
MTANPITQKGMGSCGDASNTSCWRCARRMVSPSCRGGPSCKACSAASSRRLTTCPQVRALFLRLSFYQVMQTPELLRSRWHAAKQTLFDETCGGGRSSFCSAPHLPLFFSSIFCIFALAYRCCVLPFSFCFLPHWSRLTRTAGDATPRW